MSVTFACPVCKKALASVCECTQMDYYREINRLNHLLAQKDKEGWVSVSERLPDSSNWYLCWGLGFSPTQKLWWTGHHWEQGGGNRPSYPERITHWMPLPPAPKEQ